MPRRLLIECNSFVFISDPSFLYYDNNANNYLMEGLYNIWKHMAILDNHFFQIMK